MKHHFFVCVLGCVVFILLFSPRTVSLDPQNRYRLQQPQRGIEKIRLKFMEWREEYKQDAILFVDGNNLRGIGRFKWNSLELQNHVACFCHDYNISKAIIVWDHGRFTFASTTQYKSSSLLNDDYILDLIVLFSGLSRRADDVLVSESKKLVSLFNCSDDKGDKSGGLDWPSMAFVSSDRELNYKLYRQQMASNSQSMSALRSNKSSPSPLFCDSTRLLELMRNSSAAELNENFDNHELAGALNDARASLDRFSKLQRRGYNPRREKTWERVVMAEVFRRSLVKQDHKILSHPLRTSSPFVSKYLNDLRLRGFLTPRIDEDAMQHKDLSLQEPFLGPARLDKQQRWSLERYNRFLLKGDDEHLGQVL